LAFTFNIESITFSDGSVVELEPTTTLVIIGPNSSGKSTLLQEIALRTADYAYQGVPPVSRVAQSAKCNLNSSVGDYIDWLSGMQPSKDGQFHIVGSGAINHPKAQWTVVDLEARSFEELLKALPQYRLSLFQRLDTLSRLQACDITSSIPYQQSPNHYFHVLQRDEHLLEQVNSEVRLAFGKDLIINWGAGGQVWLHAGEPPPLGANRDRVSPEYLRDLEQVPKLHEEGDGIRSYVGILLAATSGVQPVLLIDEPESFLHPPQARRIAAVLSRLSGQRKRQTLVATHSSAVLLGALDGSANVLVCRLERDGSVNHPHILRKDQLAELWTSPLLRSASALDGVFHEGVVICEADSDCQFYAALTKQIEERDGRSRDLYFVHGSGKGSIPVLARTYTQLAVRTAVIADLDLLRDRNEFRNTYESLGGNFALIATLYNTVTTGLQAQGPMLGISDVVKRARLVLDEIETEGAVAVTTSKKERIQELLDGGSDWSEAKRHGVRRLKGGAYKDAGSLLEKCRNIGLFLVPEGQMEGWWLAGPADKQKWIRKAMDEVHANPAEFDLARQFMSDVCKHLSR
jgi:predicted ATPase